jgi:DNA repair photolyase
MKNNYDSPRLSSQYIFCPVPFTLDSFAGCPHNCRYCFSYFNYILNEATKKKVFEETKEGVDIEHIRRIFNNNPRNEKERELCEFVKRKIPVHWGGITDPFSRFEEEKKISIQILKILAENDYPFIVSTKNHRLVNGEYYEALKECKKAIVQVSLISLNPRLERLETDPEIKIANRLEMIEKASKVATKVIVRLQPFIPFFCEEGLEDLIKAVSERGAKAITLEFLKFSQFSLADPLLNKTIKEISEVLGYDLENYYRNFGRKQEGDIQLYPKFKIPTIIKAKDLAHKYGMEFYCADNELRDMGDGPICCGINGTEKGFERTSNCNINKLIFKAKEKGCVSSKDFEENDKDLFSNISCDWLNVGDYKNRNKRLNMSAFDRARTIFNSRGKHSQSMSKFFYRMKFVGVDREGNNIYQYDHSKKD